MVAHTYTLNTQKVEAGESQGPGQIQLHGKILSLSKTKQKTNRIENIPESRQVKGCLKTLKMTSVYGKCKGGNLYCGANAVMGKGVVLMQ